MNQQQQSYYPESGQRVASVSVAERAKFIERTYLHLAGAIVAFVGLVAVFLNSAAVLQLAFQFMDVSPWLYIIAFIGVSLGADAWARRSTSRPLQYVALALYVVAQAFFLLPAMKLAEFRAGPEVFMTAGVSTLAIFAALTGIVLVTKKDFSWLRSTMILGLFVAIGAMIAAVAFGLTFGLGLTIFFIFIAAASILYGTSNVLHHYHPEAYVAASLSLFSSVVLLFMQLLRLFSRE